MTGRVTGGTVPDWQRVRADFPAIGDTVYLNTAGGAPLPVPVAAAATGFYEEMRDVGDRLWPEWLARVETARDTVAAFLNAPRECIAFVPTTSHGMNLAAGYLRDAGVRGVVLPADSFPAVSVPLGHAGFDLGLVPSGADGTVEVEDVAAALRADTGAVATSAVEYGTGFRHDLAALRDMCREHDLPLVVDATQCIGAFRFDVQELAPDFVMASTYKWLLGGYGLSVLYIAPRWLARRPPVAGWTSVAEAGQGALRLKQTAAVVEMGCLPFAPIFALGAGVRYLSTLGADAVEGRVRDLTAHLQSRLLEAGFRVASTADVQRQSGITLVDVPKPAEVAAQLQKLGVFVSAKGLGLRVSVYVYNTPEDLDRFVEELRRVLPSANDEARR